MAGKLISRCENILFSIYMPPLESVREEVATLMAAFRAGDSAAGARLIELFYPELKRLAARHLMGERKEHSWQPTLLVNELYLELVRIKALPPQEGERHNEKAAFFALAGQIMRRLLIHHARLLASKAQKVPLWDEMNAAGGTTLVEVEDILTRLGAIKPAIRTVVEMKVFEGLTAEEIALHLGCAAVTVNRYWQFARHWLRKEWSGPEALEVR
jgi:RNA polymerase sigma factor (TIGR02999 family)